MVSRKPNQKNLRTQSRQASIAGCHEGWRRENMVGVNMVLAEHNQIQTWLL